MEKIINDEESERISQGPAPARSRRGEQSQRGFSLISLALAISMIIVGNHYWFDCKFAASWYLYYGGVFSLVVNTVGIISSLAKWAAERDGKVSSSEKFGLWFLGVVSCILVICDLIVVIWGSVVVFGKYSGWSQTGKDPNSDYYCAQTPMMFAFVLLLLKWLLIPILFVCGCLSACFCPQEQHRI